MTRGQQAVALALAAVLGTATGCQNTIYKLKANYAVKQGNDFYKADNFLQAIQWYRYATYLNPDLDIAYYHAGLAYLAEYKPGSKHPKDIAYAKGAIDNLKRYLDDNPQNQDARNYLLTIYLQSEHYDEAADYFQRVLKQSENDPAMVSKLMQTIGMIYAKKGDFEASLEWYKKRAEVDKDDPEALYTIGQLCWEKVYRAPLTITLDRRRELIDMGIEYLKRAMEMKPDYFAATAYVNLLYREKAKLAQETGNLEEVAKNMQEADHYQKMALDMRNRANAAK